MSSVILPRLSRRSLLATGTAAVGMLAMPAILRAASAPAFTHGVQSGDAHAAGGMVWTRVDRPSRVLLEVSTTESFADPRRIAMLDALPDTDMAVKCAIDGLGADQQVFYRFTPYDLSDINSAGQPITGRRAGRGGGGCPRPVVSSTAPFLADFHGEWDRVRPRALTWLLSGDHSAGVRTRP